MSKKICIEFVSADQFFGKSRFVVWVNGELNSLWPTEKEALIWINLLVL